MIRLILLMLFFRQGFVTTTVIDMNKAIGAKQFEVNCTVDDFTSDIDIIFPKKDLGFAFCIVPVSSETNCTCLCNLTSTCNCSIRQDISTKTTTLKINYEDISLMFGCYTCAHGSYEKSIRITTSATKTCGGDKEHDETNIIVGWTVLSAIAFIAVICSILTCFFPDTTGRLLRMLPCTCRKTEDTEYLLLKEIQDLCTKCNGCSTCALCVNCRDYYCDTCCGFHIDANSTHIVLQTQHIAAHQSKLNCKKCKKLAERFCTICWQGFCTLCTKGHQCGKNGIIVIYQTHSECKRQKTVGVQEKLSHLYNVSFLDDEKPVRIYGIAFFADDTIVAVDWNNRKLIVFKSGEEKMKKGTIDEPCAMTVMTGHKFAVTYPHQKYIHIYRLTLDAMQNTCKISEEMKVDTYGKPFNIAYSHGKFAVEVGEGEDGRIIIYDFDQEVLTKTNVIECPFSFFTGRTIRLALNRDHVFISALGKQMVSCLDFDGKKLWHQSIPSPRAMIVPEDHTLGEHIFVTSKMCNAIYEMKKENGNYEILKSTVKISSPRYMAYHSDTKTFCVLVEKDNSHKAELAFFEYKDPDPNKSTSRDVETESQGLFDVD